MVGFMKILGINHIGLAPKDPEKAKKFLAEILNLPFSGSELVVEQKTKTFFYESQTGNSSLNNSRLEILEDASSPGQMGPIQSFINKKGGGIHHIALTVSDIDSAIEYLTEKKVNILSQKANNGAHDSRVVFIHPKEAGGLLIELVQPKSSSS